MIKTIVDRQVANLKKEKKQSTCLPTFLIHLNWQKGLLTPRELVEFDRQKSLQLYAEPEAEVFDDDDDLLEISPTPAKKLRPSPKKGQPSGTPRSPTPARRNLSTEALKPIGPPEHNGDLCQDLANLAGQMTEYVQNLQETTKLAHRLTKEVISLTGTDRLEECITILRNHRDLAGLESSAVKVLKQNWETIITLQ